MSISSKLFFFAKPGFLPNPKQNVNGGLPDYLKQHHDVIGTDTSEVSKQSVVFTFGWRGKYFDIKRKFYSREGVYLTSIIEPPLLMNNATYLSKTLLCTEPDTAK